MSVIEKTWDSTTAKVIQVRVDKIFTAVNHHYRFPGNIMTTLDEHIWNDTDIFQFSWCRGSTMLLLRLLSGLYSCNFYGFTEFLNEIKLFLYTSNLQRYNKAEKNAHKSLWTRSYHFPNDCITIIDLEATCIESK